LKALDSAQIAPATLFQVSSPLEQLVSSAGSLSPTLFLSVLGLSWVVVLWLLCEGSCDYLQYPGWPRMLFRCLSSFSGPAWAYRFSWAPRGRAKTS
jgi:hypothetical protein